MRLRDRSGRARRAAALLVTVVAVIPLSTACAVPEQSIAHPRVVVGSVDTAASRVLASLYAGALAAAGARVEMAAPVSAPGAVIDAMAAGTVTLYPGITGELLDAFDVSAPAAPDASEDDESYRALGRALPTWLTLADPVGADVTADPVGADVTADPVGADVAADPVGADVTADALGGESDRTVVPLYLADSLGERQDDALGTVAGELTTADLSAMVAEVRRGDTPDRVTAAWVGARSF